MQPFQFLENRKIRHFEKYLHTMMLKLTEHVELPFPFIIKNPVKF